MVWHTGSWEVSISEPHLVTVAEPLGFMAKPSALVAPQKKIVFKPRWAHGRSDQPTAWGVCFFFSRISTRDREYRACQIKSIHKTAVCTTQQKVEQHSPCHQHVLQQSLSINTHGFFQPFAEVAVMDTSCTHRSFMCQSQIWMIHNSGYGPHPAEPVGSKFPISMHKPSPIPPLQPGSAGWRGHHAQPLLGQEIFSTSCWKHLWRNWWVFSHVRLWAYEPHERR